nr:MAG TPA: hypothetical protein [Caudoviricetes sp.]
MIQDGMKTSEPLEISEFRGFSCSALLFVEA